VPQWLRAGARELFVRDRQMRLAVRNVDLDPVALLDERNRPAFGGFRRNTIDAQPAVPPANRPSVGSAQVFPSPFDFR
jgi:hypothetical protein